MKYLKHLAMTTVFSLCFGASFANASFSEKQEVLEASKNYAQSIACYTSFDTDEGHKTTLSDVYELDMNDGSDSYLVYWSGDVGCLGGSGTMSDNLTLFTRYSDTRPFLVDQNSKDIINEINDKDYYLESELINSRFIQNIDVNGSVVDIVAYSYDEGDGNCCPSLIYEYQIAYDSNSGEWILLNENFLGNR